MEPGHQASFDQKVLLRNKVYCMLRDLRLVDPDSIEEIYPRVRDSADIAVLRCAKSEIIFLSRTDHMEIGHYVDKIVDDGFVGGTDIPKPQAVEDDERRVAQIRELVRGQNWLDIGTGPGTILDLLGSAATRYGAVEPNREFRLAAIDRGHEVYESIHNVPELDFDLITLFHVFEHLLDPVGMLTEIKRRLATGGVVWLEVPHARDFLITTLSSEDFMRFTFWSEHLVLHTRESLRALLRKTGFSQIAITGYQRYPVSNHLYWLARGRPGGHNRWSFLNDPTLINGYSGTLARLDQTDTLIAIASA